MARQATTYSQAYGTAKAYANKFNIPEAGELFTDGNFLFVIDDTGKISQVMATAQDYKNAGLNMGKDMSRRIALDINLLGDLAKKITGKEISAIPKYKNLTVVQEGLQSLGLKPTWGEMEQSEVKNYTKEFAKPVEGVQETELKPGDVGYSSVAVPTQAELEKANEAAKLGFKVPTYTAAGGEGTMTKPNDATIDAQYQKYFGRVATEPEKNWWRTQDISALNQQLEKDYTAASGIPYDGSAITPGQTKTANQLATAGGARPNLVLPNGQIISGKDPNYDTYVAQGAKPASTKQQQGTAPGLTPPPTSGTPATTPTTAADIAKAVAEFRQRGKELGWPQELIDLGALAIEKYPAGQQFDVNEVINTFKKIKAETIDPYFKELTDIAINDLNVAKTQMEEDRARELEAERAAAGINIRQAKEGLEKSGMTFTGKGVETLGETSAYAQEPTQVAPETTPTQTPFGGMFYEGTVNQANRLTSSSSAARYAAQQQELGRKAESYLGQTGAAGLGINYTPAGVSQSGTLFANQQQRYASTLQDLIEQQKAKYALTTKDVLK